MEKPPTPVLKNLTSEMVPQCIRLFGMSFISQNPLWQKLNITQEEAEQALILKFKYAADTQSSFVMINESNGEIAAITITIDILDYIKYLEQEGEIQKQAKTKSQDAKKQKSGMNVLNKYGMEAQKAIFQAIGNDYERHQYLYNFGAATNPKYAKTKMSSHFWFLVTDYYKKVGYKAIFCRASTRLTTKMMGKLGGKVIKEIVIQEPGVQDQKFEVIQLNFQNQPKL